MEISEFYDMCSNQSVKINVAIIKLTICNVTVKPYIFVAI